MIRQSKILSLGQHVRGFTPNSRIIAALRVDDQSQARLIEAGFSDPIDEGQSVLPSAHLGRAAAFNAEGREEIHRTSLKKRSIGKPSGRTNSGVARTQRRSLKSSPDHMSVFHAHLSIRHLSS